MSYDVRFKEQVGHSHTFLYVGDDWINHTSNTSTLIKEVCGSRPPEWNGKRCKDIYPALVQGVSLLTMYPQQYKCFEPENGWGTIKTTIAFLEKIIANCEKHPNAVIEVTY